MSEQTVDLLAAIRSAVAKADAVHQTAHSVLPASAIRKASRLPPWCLWVHADFWLCQKVVIDEDEPKPSETPHAAWPELMTKRSASASIHYSPLASGSGTSGGTASSAGTPCKGRPAWDGRRLRTGRLLFLLSQVKRELPDQQAAPPAPPAPPAPAEAPRARADTRPTSQARACVCLRARGLKLKWCVFGQGQATSSFDFNSCEGYRRHAALWQGLYHFRQLFGGTIFAVAAKEPSKGRQSTRQEAGAMDHCHSCKRHDFADLVWPHRKRH